MTRYIAQRLLVGLLTAFLASLFIFVTLRAAPLDERHGVTVTFAIYPEDLGNPELVKWLEEMRKELGLYRPPPHIQYLHWIGGWVTGDWEKSYWESFWYEGEVHEYFAKRLPVTLKLVAMSQAIAALVGVTAGIVMAMRRDSWIDHFGRAIAKSGLAIHVVWSTSLLLVGGFRLFDWSPSIGHAPLLEDPLGNLNQFIFPAIALGYASCAAVALMMRSSTLGILRQDYVQTYPVSEPSHTAVVFIHTLKNALAPAIVALALTFPAIAGGILIVEPLFGLDGVGNMLVNAALSADYPIIESLALFFTVWVIAVNTLVDLVCGWLSPGVRSTRKSPRDEWDHLANPVRLV